MTQNAILTICFTAYCVAAVLGALLASLLELSHARQSRHGDGEGF